MKLELVKQELFEGETVDFYQNENNEVFMTISQLASSLGYSGKSSIESMVSRNSYVKSDEFSVTCKLGASDGKSYNTRFFTEDGIYEIIILSKKPKAQEFRKFIRETLKGLRKGELVIKQTNTTPSETARLWADKIEQRTLLQ